MLTPSTPQSKMTDIPNILATRYASSALRDIWSESGKILSERELWIAVMKAQRELGLPIPEEAILEAVKDVQRIVIPEENMSGQYRSVIAPLLRNKEVVGINKIGSMITPAEIEDAIL